MVDESLKLHKSDSENSNFRYAEPRIISDLKECYFYHTMDLPNIGTVRGEWDLRKGVKEYLGCVEFNNKRVLEIGPASGFVTSYIEKEGADLVGLDLSENHSWDVVPFANLNIEEIVSKRKEHIRKLNNSYWLVHRLLNLKAKLVYGSVFCLPEEIGKFDIVVLGSVLLHLRDPFLALQKCSEKAKDCIIVTDMLSHYYFLSRLNPLRFVSKKLRRAKMGFLPDFKVLKPYDTWWRLNPEIVSASLGVLGFKNFKVSFHHQPFQGKKMPLFTVVARR